LVGANIGVKASLKGHVFDVLPFVPPKRRKKVKAATQPKERRHAAPPPNHAWRVGFEKCGALFGKYEGEDEDMYRKTVRAIESALLGGR
jgi:hypothetical protein